MIHTVDVVFEDRQEQLPFNVPRHDRMLVRCSKDGVTVLTLEQMLYTWRICEYTEPLSYRSFWCYSTMEEALEGLWTYLLSKKAQEPAGWMKAVTRAEGEWVLLTRRRVDGEIVTGGDEDE